MSSSGIRSGNPFPFQHECRAFCSENGTCHEKYALNQLLAMTKHSEYKREDQVVIYIHGFHEDQTKDTVEMVVQSYTTRGDCNLVVLDWSYTAADMYPMVVTNVKPVGMKMT